MNKLAIFLKNKKLIFKFILILFSLSTTLPIKTEEKIINYEDNLISKNDVSITNGKDNIGQYILGNGDQIFIEFGGLNIFSGIYTVDPNGIITLPEIYEFKAKGKTINELKKELQKEYQKYIINPDINLFVYKYRPIFVYLTGEVKNPGLYKLDYINDSSDNDSLGNQNQKFGYFASKSVIAPKLFDALRLSSGVSNEADLSKVKVFRNNSVTNGGGKIQAEINLLSMILYGDQSQNIRLFDGDTILVEKNIKPIREQILAINNSNLSPENINVYITGNVVNQGAVVLKRGSSLNQAIASTGGKKIMTGNIEFIRFNTDGTKLKRKFAYRQNAKLNSKWNPILMDGDVINVKRTFLGNTTEVLNEVALPIFAARGILEIFD